MAAVVALLQAARAVDAVASGTDLTVFVTNETFVPGSQPGLLSGVADGDQKCQDRADAAGLGGTFKAWLSDDISSAASRHLQAVTRYVLVDGTTVVASDWTDLTDGTLQHAIDQDEYGNPTSGAAVWTGTAADGTTIAGDTCGGFWFSSVGSGRRGTSSGTDATWTTSADGDCSTAAHLYCFQQCPDVDMDNVCDTSSTTTLATTTTTTTTSSSTTSLPTTTTTTTSAPTSAPSTTTTTTTAPSTTTSAPTTSTTATSPTTTSTAPTTTTPTTSSTTTTAPSTAFRFTTSVLRDGKRFNDYADSVAVEHGTPPYSFAVEPGSVTVDGTPYPSLTAIGLALGKSDGHVYGIPLVLGAVSFRTTCTDAKGTVARSTDDASTAQPVTFDVDGVGGVRLSSTFVVTNLTIKAGFGAGKDSLTCKGVVNLGGAGVTVATGATMTFRVLGYSSPPVTFDAKVGAKTPRRSYPAVSAAIRKFGVFGASVARDTIDLGAPTADTVDVVVGVKIGALLEGSQVLRMSVKASRSGKTFSYRGDPASDLGGSFMVTRVTGASDRARTGAAWKASFIERPPSGTTLSGASTATVVIGSTAYPVPTSSRGARSSGRTGQMQVSLLTNKGNGTFTSGVLPGADTGIPAVAADGASAVFHTQVVFAGAGGVLVTGDAAPRVYSRRSQWASQ